ncbi:transglutaminase domain-containing protein [Nakamurella sp. A5-74]|uniref:Transglutaminase domain-containing protein n=1 Tax=Nakamurella sp. A5-74 TaxID=3158264 RepID=A0AAU8DTU4_9ACTN
MSAATATAPRTGTPSAPPEEAPARRPRPRIAGRALLSSLVALTVGSAFLGSTFGGWWPPLLLVGTMLLVTSLVLGLLLLRVSMPLVTLVTVILVVGTGYLLVLGAPRVGPDSQVARPAWRILLDTVAALLSTPAGTPARLDLLAPAFVVVGLASIFLVGRAQLRGPGRAMGIAPLVVAPLLYAAGLVLTAGTADRNGVVAGALLLTLVLGWTRWSPATAATAAVCAVCATLVALTSTGPGFDVRQYVTPPRIVVAQQNLLPYLPVWSVERDTPVFTVSGAVPDSVAVAVYSGFDGNTWSSGTDFALYGSPRPSVLPPGAITADYEMQVVTSTIPGDWLPATGTVTGISAPDAVIDVVGGSLVRIGQQQTPIPYTVRGSIDVADDAGLVSAGVPDRGAAAPFLAVPEVPESLQRWLNNVIARYPGRYDQAAALESALRENHAVDAKSSGSSSWYAVDALVGAGGKAPLRAAPAENYVSAFAALARSAGLPTRVVIGARLSQVPGVVEATSVVSGAQMSVWPEVYFSDIGWVAFNPVPGPTKTPAQQRHEQVKAQQTDDPEVDEEIPVVGDDPGPGAGTDDRGTDWGAVARTSAISLVLGLVVAAVLALLGSIAVIIGARRRGPAGAWSLVERAARSAGIRPAPDWTVERIADAIDVRTDSCAAHPVAGLAAGAQRARFGPQGSALPASWSDVRRVRSALRQTLPWHRRAAWFLHPAAWWPRRSR